jgi:hypothetical protein
MFSYRVLSIDTYPLKLLMAKPLLYQTMDYYSFLTLEKTQDLDSTALQFPTLKTGNGAFCVILFPCETQNTKLGHKCISATIYVTHHVVF